MLCARFDASPERKSQLNVQMVRCSRARYGISRAERCMHHDVMRSVRSEWDMRPKCYRIELLFISMCTYIRAHFPSTSITFNLSFPLSLKRTYKISRNVNMLININAIANGTLYSVATTTIIIIILIVLMFRCLKIIAWAFRVAHSHGRRITLPSVILDRSIVYYWFHLNIFPNYWKRSHVYAVRANYFTHMYTTQFKTKIPRDR